MKATLLVAAIVTAALFTSATAQVKPHAKHQRQRTVQGIKKW